jgi:hypothetical protein
MLPPTTGVTNLKALYIYIQISAFPNTEYIRDKTDYRPTPVSNSFFSEQTSANEAIIFLNTSVCGYFHCTALWCRISFSFRAFPG